MEFHPAALEVAPGDTIVWVNRDIVPHTATADGKNGWDTGILTPSHSGSIVVSRVGGSPYGCKLHPTMRGGVKVRRS